MQNSMLGVEWLLIFIANLEVISLYHCLSREIKIIYLESHNSSQWPTEWKECSVNNEANLTDDQNLTMHTYAQPTWNEEVPPNALIYSYVWRHGAKWHKHKQDFQKHTFRSSYLMTIPDKGSHHSCHSFSSWLQSTSCPVLWKWWHVIRRWQMSSQTGRAKKSTCNISGGFCNNKHLICISYLLGSKKTKTLTIRKARM